VPMSWRGKSPLEAPSKFSSEQAQSFENIFLETFDFAENGQDYSGFDLPPLFLSFASGLMETHILVFRQPLKGTPLT
jgi:hypothetical protein